MNNVYYQNVKMYIVDHVNKFNYILVKNYQYFIWFESILCHKNIETIDFLR